MAVSEEQQPDKPVIDGFSVYEVIGEGGFSRVFRAKQHSVGGREVAVKVLNRGFRSESDRHLFESECLVAGRLDHPNIVRVYQATMTDDERGCIVMERMAGTYRDSPRLTIAELVEVGVKIADVIDEAHGHGIVHHDLKPSNVFKSNRGEPALGDFGIATIAGRQPGKARMTLRYAPPEKLSEGISDSSGDIYSFGATLYELAAGVPPYVGDNDEELIRSIVFDPVPRLERMDAPAPLVSLLERCMAKEPSQRPASAREVVDELRRIQASVGSPKQPAASPSWGPQPSIQHRPSPPTAPERHDRTFDDDELGRGDRRYSRSNELPEDEPEVSRRWPYLVVALAAVAIVVASAGLIWWRDRARSSEAAEAAPTTIAGDIFVVTPPADFVVERVRTGFKFTWATNEPEAEIWIHRVGSDDNVSTDLSPFVWELKPRQGENCFEARTVLPDDAGISVGTTETVCVGPIGSLGGKG